MNERGIVPSSWGCSEAIELQIVLIVRPFALFGSNEPKVPCMHLESHQYEDIEYIRKGIWQENKSAKKNFAIKLQYKKY